MQVGGQDGIKKLLAAEQAAQSIIQEARTKKSEKIKQAQQEATSEVQQYKEQREDAYRKMMEQGKGDAEGRLTELEQSTQQTIADLDASVGSKKDEVVQRIISWVTTVS
jgi:V-type H+-transporting ATPase subunit G